MEWERVKKLKSVELIDDFEYQARYIFCSSFRRCVIANNGGRPSRQTFDTDKTKGREVKLFLSFNKEDRETVWKTFVWHREELNDHYVPFGTDSLGNLICFNANTDEIVLVDPEDMTIESIARSFTSFMNGLYKGARG